MYRSIVTHSDLDGVGSAALCSWAYGVNRVVFTGPQEVLAARISITSAEIVCDLPCPPECGLWFDHHRGNLEDLVRRRVDPGGVPGRFAAEKSCGRVILSHFLAAGRAVPPQFAPLVDALDVVDGFEYASVEEWRAETPVHVVDHAMKASFADYPARNQFYRNLVFHLRDLGLERTALLPEVRRRYAEYRVQEERMLRQLEQDARPYPGAGEIVVVDLTHHRQRPFVWKSLAQVLYPEARGIVSVEATYRDGRKTNDLALSLSLTIRENREGSGRDVAEILRTLNIGDGHRGAAAGRLPCRSKEEMLRRKDEILRQIAGLWAARNEEVRT